MSTKSCTAVDGESFEPAANGQSPQIPSITWDRHFVKRGSKEARYRPLPRLLYLSLDSRFSIALANNVGTSFQYCQGFVAK